MAVFCVQAFWAWVLETVAAALQQKTVCKQRSGQRAALCDLWHICRCDDHLYGELHGIWLFAAGFIASTLIEWTAGHLIERLYHERWWDYSNIKGNLDGYICLPVSVFWGVLSFAAMEWGNPLLTDLFELIPALPGRFCCGYSTVILLVDIVATLCILTGRSRRMEQWRKWILAVRYQFPAGT